MRMTDELEKDVFAYFGLAIFQSNCLEDALHCCLATVWNPNANTYTQAAYDETMKRLEAQTIGSLLRSARESGLAPDSLCDRIAEAVEKRNWLAHRYFRDQTLSLQRAAGQRQMITELYGLAMAFRELHFDLGERTREWRLSRGISDAIFEEEMGKLEAEADAVWGTN